MFSLRKKPTSEAVSASSVHAGASVPSKRSRQWKIVLIVMMFASMVLGSLGAAGYFYNENKKLSQKILAPADELASVVSQISHIMELPQGETPTLATVSDKDKLADQPFFQKAENGDKVLIYSQSGRAVLYRPSTQKIIDVTTVNVNTPQTVQNDTSASSAAEPQSAPETSAQPEPAAPVIIRVALLNGSTTIGVTNTVEARLKPSFSNVAVVSKEKAVKNDYTGTTIVDLSGNNTDVSGQIAASLGGVVASLPAGETAPPDADILIIVGNKQ